LITRTTASQFSSFRMFTLFLTFRSLLICLLLHWASAHHITFAALNQMIGKRQTCTTMTCVCIK
jgi:hypothetical protein